MNTAIIEKQANSYVGSFDFNSLLSTGSNKLRILIGSDLHLEFEYPIPDIPDEDLYDVVILAGDISTGINGVKFALNNFKKPVIYVPGNHEYYKHNYALNHFEMKEMCDGTHVNFLDCASFTYRDYTFVGATLWSSLVLNGMPVVSEGIIANAIADFRLIDGFSVDIMKVLNHTARKYLSEKIPFVIDIGKIPIVITHFLPSAVCVSDKYAGSSLNHYFASDTDYIMVQNKIPLWVFGHTHDGMDELHETGTRLVCNPFGYPKENAFPQWKIVTL